MARAWFVAISEQVLPALLFDLASFDEDVLDLGRELERIAAPHDDIGVASGLQRTYVIAQAEKFRRRQRHGARHIARSAKCAAVE